MVGSMIHFQLLLEPSGKVFLCLLCLGCGCQGKGISIQRMSDGTVLKVTAK